ncbi:hypothetical protein PYCC9005_004138 [Savitreella phatthalungensis]
MTLLLIGLGNPGARYAGTRHNAGPVVLRLLAEELRFGGWARGVAGSFAEGVYGGRKIVACTLDSYMNASGPAALRAIKHVSPGAFCIVHDELDLPLGSIRLRERGMARGHNGLRSCIATLPERDTFWRLGVGISRPEFGELTVEEAVALTKASGNALARLSTKGVDRSKDGAVTKHVLSDFSRGNLEVLRQVTLPSMYIALDTLLRAPQQ